MKVQTLAEIEHSIGGRPKSQHKKVRMTYYLDRADFKRLKAHSVFVDKPISVIVRDLLKTLNLS